MDNGMNQDEAPAPLITDGPSWWRQQQTQPSQAAQPKPKGPTNAGNPKSDPAPIAGMFFDS